MPSPTGRGNGVSKSLGEENPKMEKSQSKGRGFTFLKMNERPPKPRTRGVTEIRGPYYTPMGKRYLKDILETMAVYVDSLKFAGGSFSLMPEEAVRELISLAHEFDVLVSTGGFIEYVITQGREAVSRYIEECKELGFDIIEISSGFITIPTDDWLRLVEKVRRPGSRLNQKSVSSLGPVVPAPLQS